MATNETGAVGPAPEPNQTYGKELDQGQHQAPRSTPKRRARRGTVNQAVRPSPQAQLRDGGKQGEAGVDPHVASQEALSRVSNRVSVQSSSDAVVKKKMGAPSPFRSELCAVAESAGLLGCTEAEIAKRLGVSEVTLNAWKKRHPDFLKALKAGKEVADDKVARSLYERACGYSHESVKIMQYNGVPVIVPFIEKFPPDPTSMIFWLKNRQRGRWCDRIEHAGEVSHEHKFTAEVIALARKIAEEL